MKLGGPPLLFEYLCLSIQMKMGNLSVSWKKKWFFRKFSFETQFQSETKCLWPKLKTGERAHWIDLNSIMHSFLFGLLLCLPPARIFLHLSAIAAKQMCSLWDMWSGNSFCLKSKFDCGTIPFRNAEFGVFSTLQDVCGVCTPRMRKTKNKVETNESHR